MWGAWRNGIPPRPGGFLDQNVHLMDAFAVLDSADANAYRQAFPPKG